MMLRRASLVRREGAFFALALFFAAACGSTKTTEKAKCTPGDQKVCACGSGNDGTQVCNSDGTGFEACNCGQAGAGGSSAGAGGASGQGGASGTGVSGSAGVGPGGTSGSGGTAGASGSGADAGSPDASTDGGSQDAGADASTDAGSQDTGVDGGTDAGPADSGADADAGGPSPNYAFVTSTTVVPGELHLVSGASDGLDGADILCNQAAAAASLPGTYVAWLSTSSVNALDRLAGARGWVRTDGTPFADQHTMLIGGAHWFPLNRDETGAVATGLVVTGTGSSGTASGTACSDWSSTTGSAIGGAAQEMGRFWTSGKVPPCTGVISTRLYCFGIDENVAVQPPQAAGRLAFVSSATFQPGPSAGIDAADTLCQGEASTAGLPGDYKALLAADGATALSRFDTGGQMWVRTDGIPFGTLGDLLSGSLPTSINVQADGTTYTSQGFALTGANNPNVAGTVAGTCDDWQVTSGNAQGGAVLAPSSFFAGFSPSCSSGAVVYCFQQ